MLSCSSSAYSSASSSATSQGSTSPGPQRLERPNHRNSPSDVSVVSCFSELSSELILETTENVLRNKTMNPCCGSMQTGKLHDQVQKVLECDLDGWLRTKKLSWNKFLKRHDSRFKFVSHSKDDILLYGLSTSCDDPRLAIGDATDEQILQADILYARWRERIQKHVLEVVAGLPTSCMALEKVLAACQASVPRFSSFVPSKNSLKELVAPRYRVKFGELVPRFQTYQHQPYSAVEAHPFERKSPPRAADATPSNTPSAFSLVKPEAAPISAMGLPRASTGSS